jgi:cytochrome b561/polyisoprenoid-binding protein YceI
MTITAEPPFRASRYTTGAIILHWTTALFVLLQLAGGFLMADVLAEGSRQQYVVFQLHKSLGITILVLTLARVVWRLFNPPPPEPAGVARWEAVLANLVHKLFYVLLVAVPLAGWLAVSVSRLALPTNLFFAPFLPWPHLPGFGALPDAARGAWEDGAAGLHGLLAWTMGALVALHVAGALKHHLADGRFIARMSTRAGGDGPRRSYGHATAFLVALAFVLVMVASATVARRTPPPVALAAGQVLPDAVRVLAAPAAIAPGDLPAAAPAGAPRWRLVPAESALTFAFELSNAPLVGRFEVFDADIRFDPDDLPESAISASVDLTSASVAGAAVARPQLIGPDGFAATAGNPARLETSAIRAEGDGFVADAALTLRGKTVPVQLRFDVAIEGARARATGTASLDRLAFGIARLSDPDARTVSRSVEVRVEVVATRE